MTRGPVDLARLVCARCDRPLVPKDQWRAGTITGPRPHRARGLCCVCYETAKRRGELIDYERLTRPRDEVLEEWALLRSEGYTVRQAAERLGMTHWALRKAMQRARAAA